jgi:hypothetical protein
MTEQEKGLQPTTNESRVAPWGQRAEIREIAQRIQLMAPGAKRLNENEALALAQGAVAHGLDPFNGEIWFIPGSGLMAGIKGLRKAARQQIQGNFWTEFEEIKNPDDRHSMMIPDEALAFRCILRDSNTIRAYSEAWAELTSKGVPVDMVPKIIGARPYIEGVGYVKRGESTKMSPVQVAMKRAEADALKRRFDLPFAVPSEPGDDPVEGDWSELTGSPEGAPLPPAPSEPTPITNGTTTTPTNGTQAKSGVVTAFWAEVKHQGLSTDEGKRALQECNGDFEEALRRMQKGG